MATPQVEPVLAAEPAVAGKHDPSAAVSGPAFPTTPDYFARVLNDAERLLKYAAEFGIAVDDKVRGDILHARALGVENWDEATAASVLAALSNLSSHLKPITADSIRACEEGTGQTVRSYLKIAIWLAIVIVPFSLASFISSAISNTIKTDIATANDLAVKLRAQLGPSGATRPALDQATQTLVIGELQDYAAAIRAIDSRSRQLNALFVLFYEKDPFAPIRNNPTAIHEKLQLPAGLADFADAAEQRTTVYQDVRYFAQSVLDDISIFYGAVTACILPVLYALLGTCAYLLRSFEQQMALKTYMPSAANSARFLIAGIGGAVVGLFNNFIIGQGASIPPLALAFLVGYAVDVFFTFLETMLQTFTRTPSAQAATAAQK
jgi:hypothetical protein